MWRFHFYILFAIKLSSLVNLGPWSLSQYWQNSKNISPKWLSCCNNFNRTCLKLSEDSPQINKSSEQHKRGEEPKKPVRVQKVEWDHPHLWNQKYLQFKDQLHGWWILLGSHAPALCLFQLHPEKMGEAHSWVVCPTWSHTLWFVPYIW